jgi:hypothetical protein
MNLFNDQAVKIRKVETVLAGLFIAAMIFGAVCLLLDMADQAAVRGSVRICVQTK